MNSKNVNLIIKIVLLVIAGLLILTSLIGFINTLVMCDMQINLTGHLENIQLFSNTVIILFCLTLLFSCVGIIFIISQILNIIRKDFKEQVLLVSVIIFAFITVLTLFISVCIMTDFTYIIKSQENFQFSIDSTAFNAFYTALKYIVISFILILITLVKKENTDSSNTIENNNCEYDEQTEDVLLEQQLKEYKNQLKVIELKKEIENIKEKLDNYK